jgi:DNA polymerase-1
VRAACRKSGRVETLFGRRIHLPGINEKNPARRGYAERQAINAPMQGTAADIIKRAMIGIDGWLEPYRDRALMILQVHDELVFEVDAGFVDTLLAQVITRMGEAAELRVPLVVDSGVGDNWDEAH